MPNPILPLWEHIPDGEPRVFGNRVYLYGSHDRSYSDSFCDTKLKVWSAPVDDLEQWTSHGDIFHSQADEDHAADVTWHENGSLYAPDVVEKDGKYYLFAYVFYGKGCVAVSDKPWGPFKVLSTYTFSDAGKLPEGFCNDGVFVDPGVLVDDDGKVFVYCGFEASYAIQMDRQDITRALVNSYYKDIIPADEPFNFYEACSPRKIDGTYYLIYSPRIGSRLAYATSKSPMGPFTYGGVIIDNGLDYPGGNNHGSIIRIGGQWYVFYHRTSNGTVHSRQACAERIEILPDGSIPQVEMTSLGFQTALNPYQPTPAHIACVIRNGGMAKELNAMRTVLGGLQNGSVIGYKYFDFGNDRSGTGMTLLMEVRGLGETGRIRVMLDDPEAGQELGTLSFGGNSELLKLRTSCVTGRHAVYFVLEDLRRQDEWGFRSRELLQVECFVFTK
jgi:arabinoxylan arabinofuranohydrolase